jgi:glycogen synthase
VKSNPHSSTPGDAGPGDAQPTTGGPQSSASRPRAADAVRKEPLLVEVAWEVCNQVGGIYTVIRSKAPAMVEQWGTRYCLLGPYQPATAAVEFEPAKKLTGPFGLVAQQMRDRGVGAHFGRWLVTGRPQVVLLQYLDVFPWLHEVKYKLWNDHGISLPSDDEMLNNVMAFGEVCRMFLTLLGQRSGGRRDLVAHCHEWMAGVPVPMLRRQRWPGTLVFTTHATLLGRYLATNNSTFYDHLPYYNAEEQAKRFNIEPQFKIERAAAHGAQVFTTVSDVTADECKYLLGRAPDTVLPNGLNIQRFERLHELQILHRQFKEKIHEFTIGHFFPSYNFDLDKTLYFFTSGRYEYRNKGMDLTIEALARLNHQLRAANTKVTVVAFIVTKRPFKSINVTALHSASMLEEFHTVAQAIQEQVRQKVFYSAVKGKMPDFNAMVEDYWLLRLRRNMQAWRRDLPPGIVTHDLVDDATDEVLNQLRVCHLWNQKHDPVKVIYHPDFINPTNPLFGMDYDQFVRGCHLGVFPSYYEPWGYTPLESIALGVPAIASDLSGFGAYLLKLLPDHEERGLYVLRRRYKSFEDAAQRLADRMFRFCQLTRRERITLRNNVESFAEHFDWHNLATFYHEAHQLARDRMG